MRNAVSKGKLKLKQYLGETHHEHQVDGDESEQISHDHAVYHHYEGTDSFEAAKKITKVIKNIIKLSRKVYLTDKRIENREQWLALSQR